MARITELNLELSLLKLDDLNDPTAARKEVEAALQASPDNPAALGALARLHLKANDFAAYSAVRMREAKALAGKPEAVEALLDAGRVYREQLDDPAKARDAFEAALREDPDNAEALHALASVLSARGELGRGAPRAHAAARDHQRLERARGGAERSRRASPGRGSTTPPRRSDSSTRRWRWSPTTSPPSWKSPTSITRKASGSRPRSASPRRCAGCATSRSRRPGCSSGSPRCTRRPASSTRPTASCSRPTRWAPASCSPSCRWARTASAPASGARRRCTSARSPITPTPPPTPTRWRTPWPTPRRRRSSCAGPSAPSSSTRRPLACAAATAPRCARWPIWRSSAASGRRRRATCAAWPTSRPTAPSARRRWSSSAISTSSSTTRRRRSRPTTTRTRPPARRRRSRSRCWRRRSSCSARAATRRRRPRPRRCSSIWSRIPRSAPSGGATPRSSWPSRAR